MGFYYYLSRVLKVLVYTVCIVAIIFFIVIQWTSFGKRQVESAVLSKTYHNCDMEDTFFDWTLKLNFKNARLYDVGANGVTNEVAYIPLTKVGVCSVQMINPILYGYKKDGVFYAPDYVNSLYGIVAGCDKSVAKFVKEVGKAIGKETFSIKNAEVKVDDADSKSMRFSIDFKKARLLDMEDVYACVIEIVVQDKDTAKTDTIQIRRLFSKDFEVVKYEKDYTSVAESSTVPPVEEPKVEPVAESTTMPQVEEPKVEVVAESVTVPPAEEPKLESVAESTTVPLAEESNK